MVWRRDWRLNGIRVEETKEIYAVETLVDVKTFWRVVGQRKKLGYIHHWKAGEMQISSLSAVWM